MRQDCVWICKRDGALKKYQLQFCEDYCIRHNSLTGGAFKYDGKKHTKRDYVELDEKEYARLADCVRDVYKGREISKEDMDSLVKAAHANNWLLYRRGADPDDMYTCTHADYIRFFQFGTKIGQKNFEDMNYEVAENVAINHQIYDKNGMPVITRLNAKNGKECLEMLSGNGDKPLYSFDGRCPNNGIVDKEHDAFIVSLGKFVGGWGGFFLLYIVLPLLLIRACAS
ncbi:MAG: hypothetical protein K5860_02415 [Bacteroidales bacterium]|nr:hypothetical protein [Bacteroidales bacterium]